MTHDYKATIREDIAHLPGYDVERAKALSDGEVEELLNETDGKLTLQEFMGAAPAIKLGETPDQIVQRLDANHDGRISTAEFRDPEVAKFKRVDANHDGIATPQEVQAARK